MADTLPSNSDQTQLGNKVFLAGVSGQGASYVLFTLLTIVAHIRLCREEPRYAPWHALHNKTARLFVLLYVASIGILVRSGMRIVEMAQGYGGQLYSHEIYTVSVKRACRSVRSRADTSARSSHSMACRSSSPSASSPSGTTTRSSSPHKATPSSAPPSWASSASVEPRRRRRPR
jgi:hypothetical protein